jgi:hypothetical protein
MEEFEKLLAESFQSDLLPGEDTSAEASSSPPAVEEDTSEEEITAETAEGAEPGLATELNTEEEENEARAATKPE